MENETAKNNWAETHNTSTEIADAINEISVTTRTMEQIWDEPTDAEFRNVVARADEIACHEAESFDWGCFTIIVHVDEDPTCFSDRYDF